LDIRVPVRQALEQSGYNLLRAGLRAERESAVCSDSGYTPLDNAPGFSIFLNLVTDLQVDVPSFRDEIF
jgi:hypothetical protein